MTRIPLPIKLTQKSKPPWAVFYLTMNFGALTICVFWAKNGLCDAKFSEFGG